MLLSPEIIDWCAIADGVWQGKTVRKAAEDLGYEWRVIDRALNTDRRSFLVDVSMLANVKEEYLNGNTIRKTDRA